MKILIQDSFLKRFLGLMGKKTIPQNIGFLFKNCKSIHTCFMRFSIDVYGLNKDFEVVEIQKKINPFRLILFTNKTKHIVEFSSSSKNLELGEKLLNQNDERMENGK